MTEILKKFWFVILVSLIFIGIIGLFITDKANSVFKGLTVDGQDIIYAINGDRLTADEFYETYYKQNGTQLVASLVRIQIADKTVTFTDDEIATYKTEAASILEQYVSYGYSEDDIQNSMQKSGYKSWEDYYISSKKVDKIIQDYVDVNQDTYFPEFLEKKTPRIVSHLLISMTDPENPTEEELSRVKVVEEAIAAGETFDTVAFKYSEDENTRINNGSIGYLDSDDTTYVTEFRTAALALNEGETSEWVKTKYGWHLIHIDSESYDDLKAETDFYSAIISYYSDDNLSGKAMWEKFETLEITFTDETLKDKIKEIWVGGEE